MIPINPKLTDRQSKVLELFMEGDSNQEIAKKLELPIRSVYSSIASIRAKYGCVTDSDLFQLVERQGGI